MDSFRLPQVQLETIWRTVLVTDARNSSKAYFSEKGDEALVRIERDRALFAQIAAGHGGEEVRDRGDGSMFAFCDPAAALQAAMAMQGEVARLNAAQPAGTLRLVHRMGLHMGEMKLATARIALHGVESVRRKLSGDIVVTAARLEAICHPGEVCFSNEAYKAVRGKVEHDFRCLDSTMKGFDRPVRCWSTRLDREWARPLTAEEESGKQRQKTERRLREKWEDEQRERRRYRRRLWLAVPFALGSLAYAGLRYVQTNDEVARRIDHAWAVLIGAPVPEAGTATAPSRPSTPSKATHVAPVATLGVPPSRAKDRPKWDLSHPDSEDRSRMRETVRNGLENGEFGLIATAFREDLHPANAKAIVAAAARLEGLKSWLNGRLMPVEDEEHPPMKSKVPLGKEGMVVLSGTDGDGIVGTDESGKEVRLTFGEMTPRDLMILVSTATPRDHHDDPPKSPDLYASDLSMLRKIAGM